MKYLVYRITNKINNKIYIGAHQTSTINDGYMGSGKHLLRAQHKYGIENFSKEILFEFDNATEMYAKELEIVDETFVNSAASYNLKIGGEGGFDHINNDTEFKLEKNRRARATTNIRYGDKIPEWGSLGGKANIAKHGLNEKFLEAGKTAFAGKQHSIQTKENIGRQNSIHQAGEGNSQFGTQWITNGVLSRKINKLDSLPEGWNRGRKMRD